MTTSLHRDFVPFLKELTKNNNRPWFEKNKPRFEERVQGSMLEFLEELQPRLQDVSKHIAVVPKKVGGSLMRIYRDTRFGKDKSPYHTFLACRFRHVSKKAESLGFYLRVSPDGVTLGAGIWRPEPPQLKKIRAAIDRQSGPWEKARDDRAFAKAFGGLEGESLKRPPAGFAADHPHIEDLKRKDFVAFREMSAGSASRKDFLDKVVASYDDARPFMAFLCKALGAQY